MQLQVSEDLNLVIKYAREEAMRTGSYGIGPDHLFLGIIRQEENAAFRALQSLGVEPADLKTFIDQRIVTGETLPYEQLDHIAFSRQSQNVLSITVMEASRLKSPLAQPQHLLLALCRTTESYGQVYLRSHGIDYGRLLAYMEDEGLLRPKVEPKEEQPSQGPDEEPEEKKLDIEEFAFDLTRAAREGKLDPVVGRDNEISRVIEILGRRKKNNPMLIGEPGVGKSAIVEGIAQKIAFYLLMKTRRESRSSVIIPESVSNWALMMNVSRTSLHREIKRLESEGMIAYRPPVIEIIDRERLQEVLGE